MNGIPCAGNEGQPETLGLLMEMELPVLVRFGKTRMLLGEVKKLGPGSVIDFGPAPQNSVEVVVNRRVVARGLAVFVDGNYGVRITEIGTCSSAKTGLLLRNMAGKSEEK